MTKALINADILGWALQRADLPSAALAQKVHVRPDLVSEWLNGSAKPSFAQARRAAAVLGIPFGYLYLQRPPADELPLPDLRTVGGERPTPDINLRSLLSDVLFKHDWYREFLAASGGEELPFVASFDLDAKPTAIAADITRVVLGERGRPTTGSFEDYLQRLMLSADEVGIWVMRTGIVGNNTHRPLAVSMFRGLALADPIAPLVLINGQDSKSAQIFTLAHELAHIWLGASGVSNVELGEKEYGVHRRIEILCNAVAAEFLTPEDEFSDSWHTNLAFAQQVDLLSKRFKVSRVVIGRRALDLGYLSHEEFSAFYQQERQRWRDINRDSGGDFFATLPVRNGRKFTRAVLDEAMRGNLLLRNAGALLGVQPAKLRKSYERLAS